MTTIPSKRSSDKWAVPFNDVLAGLLKQEDDLHMAYIETLSSGQFILDEQVKSFENQFAKFTGVTHAVGVASGTDALILALYACGIKEGETVLTVANSAPATVTAIRSTGAKVKFADIDERGLMDPEQLKDKRLMEGVRAVMPVHLYGRVADMQKIAAVCDAYAIPVIEDAAQAAGAFSKDYKLGSKSAAVCFSFYPTKNLGALGDGGMVLSNDKAVADRVRLLRNYGLFDGKQVLYGMNSRLDELQAAFLKARLHKLPSINIWRREICLSYRKKLDGMKYLKPSDIHDGDNGHLFVVHSEDRDHLKAFLEKEGIQTIIHYPIPTHRQPAEKEFFYPFPLKKTDEHCNQVLSLPCWYLMPEHYVNLVVKAVRRFFNET
jgi:dTDP-4-amino-4,6-dideoxygalactose transaminase